MNISIIVPLYNEENRAEPFLNDLFTFSKRKLKNYEIILVNDGSVDNTLDLINKFNGKNVKIISYKKNRGKGAAVKAGVKVAYGKKILFIDADGSISPPHILEMLKKLDEYDVVVGDRSSKKSDVDVILTRKITGMSFNFIVNLLYNLNINDTLCGFKGFRKHVAKKLFNRLISYRWIFDVELFYKIKKNNYKLYRMPLKWNYRSGSKFTIFGILKTAFQLIDLRLKIDRE